MCNRRSSWFCDRILKESFGLSFSLYLVLKWSPKAVRSWRWFAARRCSRAAWQERSDPDKRDKRFRDKRSCWRFKTTVVLQKKLPLWPYAVTLPFIPSPCSGVARSSCPGAWFAELKVNGLPPLDFSCDLDDSVVWRSILENSALPGKLGSLSVTWRAWDATQGATDFAVLAPCTHSSWWLLFETIFGKLCSVPRTFGFVFRDQ